MLVFFAAAIGRKCSYCKFAYVDAVLVEQTEEQARECVYEKTSRLCLNGETECVGEGGRNCTWELQPPSG